MRKSRYLFALIIAFIPVAGLAQETTDSLIERGFKPDGTYSMGDIDSVDMFRGSLSMVIPIGQSYHVNGGFSYQFKLVYNSEIWEAGKSGYINDHEVKWVHRPNSYYNVGMGWMLNLGILLDPDDAENFQENWIYIDPSGAEHKFIGTLHNGESGTADTWYTRDGSYLRLVKKVENVGNVDREYRVVQSPDGVWHYFFKYRDDEAQNKIHKKWRLEKTEDRFGNKITLSYATGDGRPTKVTDSVGREHTFTYNTTYTKYLTSVSLTAFNSDTATYSFEYQWPVVRWSCHENIDIENPSQCKFLNGAALSGNPPDPNSEKTALFLVSITQPDGSQYRMKEQDANSTPTYYTECGTNCLIPGGIHTSSGNSGAIKKIYLPTGGSIEWEHIDNTYDWEEPYQVSRGYDVHYYSLQWSGVSQRTFYDPITGKTRTWKYRNQANPRYMPSSDICKTRFANNPGNCFAMGDRPEERRMVVTDPDGNDTVHYFRAYPATPKASTTHMTIGSDYGLPYTERVPDSMVEDANNKRYLSVQYFQGSVSFNDNDQDPNAKGEALKTPVREDYVSYFLDPSANGCQYRHLNRHPLSQRTVYKDDGDRHTKSVSANFDGLGHFRKQISTTDINSTVEKVSFTNFNPGGGTYPITAGYANFSLPDPEGNWMINLPDYSIVRDGTEKITVDTCYNVANGFLLGKRSHQSKTGGGSDAWQEGGPGDLLVLYSPDSYGNVETEKYYGGDLKPMPTNGGCTSGATHNGNYTAFGYGLKHTYSYGSRATSQHINASGNLIGFKLFDKTIDQSTGLASSITDPTGLVTQVSYDTMGRITKIKPSAGAISVYQYRFNTDANAANSSVRPAAASCQYPNNSSATDCFSGTIEFPTQWTSGALTRGFWLYDGFGTMTTEHSQLPGGVWNKRVTEFDLKGRKSTVSEWVGRDEETTGKLTQFLDYDLFGRPGSISLPDGSVTSFAYRGVRETDRTVSIMTAANSPTLATTTEVKDGFGQLVAVKEPITVDGSGNPTFVSSYTYNVAGKLTTVCQNDNGSTCGQTRKFTYDGLGLLRGETIPEKANNVNITGNIYCNGVSTCHTQYDAKGHLLETNDTGTVLKFGFDDYERLLYVRSGNNQDLKSFTYDNANNNGLSTGKLIQAAMYNTPGGSDNIVTENYTYNDPRGLVSEKKTRIQYSGLDFIFNQKQTYNDLGLIETKTYPTRPSEPDPVRTITYAYDAGRLKKVLPYYVQDVNYYSSGMVQDLVHYQRTDNVSAGARDNTTISANAMARPAVISTYRPNYGAVWSTGAYQYDGAGNIWAIGDNRYTYDLASRLKTSIVKDANDGSQKQQNVTYDGFGNILNFDYDGSARDRTFDVNASTNRLNSTTGNSQYSPVDYDNAGNITSALGFLFTWNALNQMKAATGGGINDAYLYSVDGERVLTDDIVGGRKLITIRDAGNRVLREYIISSGVWDWKDYIYAGGRLVNTVSSPSGIRHYHQDHLGTTRLVTERGAGVLTKYSYLPFGLETTPPSASSPEGTEDRLRFTGHERDFHSNATELDSFDYMHARYYTAVLGRFLSVDPARGNEKLPATWSRYLYVIGNPLNGFDPTGLLTALIYGQEKDVNPGDIVVLVDKSGAKHVVMVHSFVQVSSGKPPNAFVVENSPVTEKGKEGDKNNRENMVDDIAHLPTPVDSNSPQAGSGIWNSQTGFTPKIVSNTNWDGTPFTTEDVDRARLEVGFVIYDNQRPGTMLFQNTDCAGYVNRLVEALDGTQKARFFQGLFDKEPGPSSFVLAPGKSVSEWNRW